LFYITLFLHKKYDNVGIVRKAIFYQKNLKNYKFGVNEITMLSFFADSQSPIVTFTMKFNESIGILSINFPILFPSLYLLFFLSTMKWQSTEFPFLLE